MFDSAQTRQEFSASLNTIEGGCLPCYSDTMHIGQSR